MSTLLPPPCVALHGTARHDERQSRDRLWHLLSTTYQGATGERRRDPRFPYPRLIVLQPLGEDRQTHEGPPVTVVGKYISESGLGFFHPQPIRQRYVRATIEAGDGGTIELLLELTWCRFTRHQWYESGGRFVGGTSVLRCVAREGQTAVTGG